LCCSLQKKFELGGWGTFQKKWFEKEHFGCCLLGQDYLRKLAEIIEIATRSYNTLQVFKASSQLFQIPESIKMIDIVVN